MVRRNPAFHALSGNYLFQDMRRRIEAFKQKRPHAELISLGIGDTTEPLTPYVTQALIKVSTQMGQKEGYSGYGLERGELSLRKKISERIYKGVASPEEIYISDGCKCDIGRLQTLFGSQVTIAVQDPAYPVYIDGSLLQGVRGIQSLPCTQENHFFPHFKAFPRTDLIYICSPNNPTGVAATYAQLEELVHIAYKQRSIILFDAAYAEFIQDASLPKSIYEIPGARSVAIEMSSFSKLAGFTGMRLGWTVVPEELKYECGHVMARDWHRIVTTIFNGASYLVQKGGEAVLEDQGWMETKQTIKYYLHNALLLKTSLEKQGMTVFGGDHAPYLWAYFPNKKSWDVFEEFLEKYEIITTPGVGFGPGGEGYVRLSALGQLTEVEAAIKRLCVYNYMGEG